MGSDSWNRRTPAKKVSFAVQRGQEQEVGEELNSIQGVLPTLGWSQNASTVERGLPASQDHSFPPPTPWMGFQSQTQEGGPGRGTRAFHQDCFISGFALLEISSLEAWIAATWGFNLGWAWGLVVRNPKRRTINITKAGSSVRLRFPLSPHQLMFWKAQEETFLSISATLSLGLCHMQNHELSVTC